MERKLIFSDKLISTYDVFTPSFPENAEIPLKTLLDVYFYLWLSTPFRLVWNEQKHEYEIKRSALRQVFLTKCVRYFLQKQSILISNIFSVIIGLLHHPIVPSTCWVVHNFHARIRFFTWNFSRRPNFYWSTNQRLQHWSGIPPSASPSSEDLSTFR